MFNVVLNDCLFLFVVQLMDQILHHFISACFACHLIGKPCHPQFQSGATDTWCRIVVIRTHSCILRTANVKIRSARYQEKNMNTWRRIVSANSQFSFYYFTRLFVVAIHQETSEVS